ncbi:MAG: dipeptidase [Clostridia bacterium]|nr:dipeptidase [Clostridia bacterium]
MKYIDLHSDTLTAAFDGGYSPLDCPLQASFNKLNKSGCAAQCLAVFTEGEGAALNFEKYLSFYKSLQVKKITKSPQLKGDFGVILTIENLGFIGGDLSYISKLKRAGVKMASLVWNSENELAYPNVTSSGREKRGLKPLGKAAVEFLDKNKIIIDISHLSDGGAEEILTGRKIPAVASHSDCAEVCNVPRNLTNPLIKKIADCGGVVGVNFHKKFLGEGKTFDLIEMHIKHLIKVGGEDIIALGSDFDGIPAPPDLEDCTKVPVLLERLNKTLGCRVCEKLRYKNFERVFNEVCR